MKRLVLRVAGVLLAVIAGILLLAATGTRATAAVVTVPASLSPGDEYRLAFVTSTARDATSPDISVYNDFVAGVANGVSELSALGTNWKAVASTASVNARDNTGTLPLVQGGSEGVPIFLLDGTKFASNNDDLWSGIVLANLIVDEEGNFRGTALVFTGSDTDGTAFDRDSFFRPLGAEIGPSAGRTDAVHLPDDTYGWVICGNANWDDVLSFYAFSDVLAVPATATIPEPCTLIVWSLLGASGVGIGWWRRRRAA